MRHVYAIGETVWDLIFRDGQPIAAKAGGAMLNTAVSLGRCGLDVHFISEYGHDMPGDEIDHFLKDNGVNTTHVYRFSNGQTPLALAFLDADNNASYDFYKPYPPDRLAIELPETASGDMVLFGSFYAITEAVRPKIKAFVEKAHDNGAIIIYDPNFRRSHLKDLPRVRPMIEENIGLAHLVRGSDEDFAHIFGAENAKQAYNEIHKLGCESLVYTQGADGAWLFNPKGQKHYPAEPAQVLSTIGAGDNFNAGIIYGLCNAGLNKCVLTNEAGPDMARIMQTASGFSAHVCESYDNYISREFARGMQ
jgi:fructokinase